QHVDRRSHTFAVSFTDWTQFPANHKHCNPGFVVPLDEVAHAFFRNVIRAQDGRQCPKRSCIARLRFCLFHSCAVAEERLRCLFSCKGAAPSIFVSWRFHVYESIFRCAAQVSHPMSGTSASLNDPTSRSCRTHQIVICPSCDMLTCR